MLTDPAEDYARGFVPFLGVRVFLDSHPLIPRPETEFWTEQAIADIHQMCEVRTSHRMIEILDLFAGSGCIGLAVLKNVPEAHVDFADIEARHFPTIEKSIRENALDGARAKCVETDVFSAITGTYDFILANPPYLSKHHIGRVQDSVLAYEPPEALFAEDEGFALIEKTVRGASKHLSPPGVLFIEHEPEQENRLQALGNALGFRVETRKDQYGVARFSRLSRMA